MKNRGNTAKVDPASVNAVSLDGKKVIARFPGTVFSFLGQNDVIFEVYICLSENRGVSVDNVCQIG